MQIHIPKFNDVWLDNALANFYSLLYELYQDDEVLEHLELHPDGLSYSFSDQEAFVDALAQLIISYRSSLVVIVENSKTGERKENKKDHVLIQEGKKLQGKVSFKENIFNEQQTVGVLQEIYQNLKGKKLRCFFCNRPFKKKIKNIQQASYPFVTKIASLSGIRSGQDIKLTEYTAEYCPQCYLLGVLEWLDPSLVYRNLPKQKSIIILPNLERLDDLVRLKNSYYRILENTQRWSNIRTRIDLPEVENTPGRYTTFVSFLEKFLRYMEPKFDKTSWFIIEIPQSGSVKNPKYFNIALKDKTLRLLDTLLRRKESYVYSGLIKNFYLFYNDPKKQNKRDFDLENEIHEQLCKALILDDFKMFALSFVPQRGVHPGISHESMKILNQLIFYWRVEPMKLENKEEYVKTVGMAASTLAKLIGTRLGLFFKLEKANNPRQFMEAVQEITRRMMIDDTATSGALYTHAVEKLLQWIIERYDEKDGKEFFETTKNMLLIYTSLRAKKDKVNL